MKEKQKRSCFSNMITAKHIIDEIYSCQFQNEGIIKDWLLRGAVKSTSGTSRYVIKSGNQKIHVQNDVPKKLAKKIAGDVASVESILVKKRLEKCLGDLLIYIPSSSMLDSSTAAGYHRGLDIIVLPPRENSKNEILTSMLHELGHRYNMKILSWSQRTQWVQFINSMSKGLTEEDLLDLEGCFKSAWETSKKLIEEEPPTEKSDQIDNKLFATLERTEKYIVILEFTTALLEKAKESKLKHPALQALCFVADFGYAKVKELDFSLPFEEFYEPFKSMMITRTYSSLKISSYSNRSPAEAWAETFAFYCLNKSLPKEVKDEFEYITELKERPSQGSLFKDLQYRFENFLDRLSVGYKPTMSYGTSDL
jgi:hypothetical protein